MAKPTGFMDYSRQDPAKRTVESRLKDYREFEYYLTEEELRQQAARCMDCGIPFCHAYGCPVKNLIPDFNEMIYRGQWQRALELLHKTNNFPEVTGRVCPAPCEAACTLAINQPSVTIKHIELQIVERGWKQGWIVPQVPAIKTNKRVAVIGSGPAGLAAAQQLARAGHEVIVFEKDDRIGGLLRYGIPDFKMEKSILDRRIAQMTAEGVVFEPNVNAGVDISPSYLERSFDAILIATGAGVPRDLAVPGRELDGIHLAMTFLGQNNRRIAGDIIMDNELISAKGKHVVVIGGGDTGSDCIGTSNRQGARSVTQIELLPQPPEERVEYNPWPEWPNTMRTSSSQEEGCERLWSINTSEFTGNNNAVSTLQCRKLEWTEAGPDGRMSFKEIEGSDFELQADLVFLAMGFIHPEHGPLVIENELELDPRGNVAIDSNYMTSKPGIFAAGDAMTGASLVVRAIDHGRLAAARIDEYLREK
jgi:NAD(P)H-dependent glutamate synthase small subunit